MFSYLSCRISCFWWCVLAVKSLQEAHILASQGSTPWYFPRSTRGVLLVHHHRLGPKSVFPHFPGGACDHLLYPLTWSYCTRPAVTASQNQSRESSSAALPTQRQQQCIHIAAIRRACFVVCSSFCNKLLLYIIPP